MATAGFIVVFMKSVTKPPEEEAMAALKDIITKGEDSYPLWDLA